LFHCFVDDAVRHADTYEADGGVDIAEALLKDSPSLKVLFTTGYAETAREDILVKLPGAQVIGKPYRMAELLTAVRDALEQGG